MWTMRGERGANVLCESGMDGLGGKMERIGEEKAQVCLRAGAGGIPAPEAEFAPILK